MAPERERPLTSIPTIDNNPDRLFRVWQRLGRMPPNYNSFDEVGQAFLHLVKVEGLTQEEARVQLGVDHRNVVGQPFLSINQDSKGKFRGLNKRAIREDINVVEELAIRSTYSDAFYEDFEKYLRTQWDRTAKLDIKKINKHLNAFGKTGRGRWHRGHGFSAMDGAGVSRENVAPELGRWNVKHGSVPRFSPEIMRDLDMSSSDLQAMYDRQLRMEGFDINPRRFNELFVAADEAMNFPDDPAVRFRPEQLEMTNQRLFELQQQGVPSATLERYAREQSFLLDDSNATAKSGPSRTVRAPDVVTDGRGRTRFNMRGAQYLPLVPIGLGIVTAGQQVKAGEYSAAAGTAVDTVMGEIPVVENLVPDPTSSVDTVEAQRQLGTLTRDDKPGSVNPDYTHLVDQLANQPQ